MKLSELDEHIQTLRSSIEGDPECLFVYKVLPQEAYEIASNCQVEFTIGWSVYKQEKGLDEPTESVRLYLYGGVTDYHLDPREELIKENREHGRDNKDRMDSPDPAKWIRGSWGNL